MRIADWKVTRKQKRLVNKVLDSGQLTYGPITQKFESSFAWLYGRKYGIFLNSGLDALRLSLIAYKELNSWKDGDEVIIPAVTFIATYNAVTQAGLKPVLVDIDESFNINPHLIEAAVTKRTRAIMPVNLLGKPCEMFPIMDVAINYNLKVIEDSCETMSIEPTGEMSDVVCFSTYLAHHLVTGVGGLIVTDDKDLVEFVRSMMWHGRTAPGEYVFDKPGYSSRGTDLQAALGMGALENLDKDILARQANARIYADELTEDFDYNHSYQFYPMMTRQRDKLIKFLKERDIETRTLMPLTNQPIVKVRGKFPVAERVNREGLLLPCHPYLKEKDIKHICKTIKEFYG